VSFTISSANRCASSALNAQNITLQRENAQHFCGVTVHTDRKQVKNLLSQALKLPQNLFELMTQLKISGAYNFGSTF